MPGRGQQQKAPIQVHHAPCVRLERGQRSQGHPVLMIVWHAFLVHILPLLQQWVA